MEVNRGYYQARGVKLNDVFLPAIPDGYHIYALRGGRWRKIDSFDGCKYLEDIYLVPIEKKINYAFLRR